MFPKLTIRSLMLFVAISAIFAWLLRTNDWLVAAGSGLAALAIVLAVRIGKSAGFPRLTRFARALLLLISGGLIWFSIVDSSLCWECCQNCGDHRFVKELRVVGIPIASTDYPYHTDLVSQFRTDLGIPCTHEFAREHLVREWGLAISARPRVGITCCLSGDPEYYNNSIRARVRQYAAANPAEACDLCNRVVNDNDLAAMRSFIVAMKNGE